MNTGRIIKSETTERFTTLPNELIKGKVLTLDEKGLISFLLSLPTNWVIYKQNLYNSLPDSKGTIDRIFKSLQDKGFIESVKVIDEISKRFIGWNHVVYDIPRDRQMPKSENAEIGKTAPIIKTDLILKTNIIDNNSIKEKKPSLQEVIEYFILKNSTEEKAKQAFEYYDTANWHDSSGKKVKNWKQKMLAVWINNTNFNKTTQNEKTKRTNLDFYRDAYEQSIKWAEKWDANEG